MTNTVQLLLTSRGRPLSADRIEETISAVVRCIGHKLSDRMQCRGLVRVSGDPTSTLPHGRETSESLSFDAAIELVGEPLCMEEIHSALATLSSDMNGWIDWQRSAALAGTVHVIVPGEENLMFLLAIRRRSSLTRTQFEDHWHVRHAELGRRIPGSLGYRQVRAEAELSRAAAAAVGAAAHDFDGAALAFHTDVASFLTRMRNPAVAETALADERRFIDHGRSFCGLFRQVAHV